MPVVAVVDPCVKCHIGAAATERLSLFPLPHSPSLLFHWSMGSRGWLKARKKRQTRDSGNLLPRSDLLVRERAFDGGLCRHIPLPPTKQPLKHVSKVVWEVFFYSIYECWKGIVSNMWAPASIPHYTCLFFLRFKR